MRSAFSLWHSKRLEGPFQREDKGADKGRRVYSAVTYVKTLFQFKPFKSNLYRP